MSSGFRYREEAGNMAPLAVSACLVVAMSLGLVVDLGAMQVAKQRQEQALDAARARCMDAVTASSAKYAEDPGAVLSDAIVGQVRAQGVPGAVTVWFYEAPEQALPESERAWVVGMQVEQAAALAFPVGGMESADVVSSRVFTAKPYAAEHVWRPSRRILGAYRYEDGASAGQGSFRAIGSLEAFPEEMVLQARSLQG